jgi:hypothetical protein
MLSPWQRGAWHQGKEGRKMREVSPAEEGWRWWWTSQAAGEDELGEVPPAEGCSAARSRREKRRVVTVAVQRRGGSPGAATTGQEAVERPNAGELLGRRKWRWQSFTPTPRGKMNELPGVGTLVAEGKPGGARGGLPWAAPRSSRRRGLQPVFKFESNSKF